MSREPNVTKSAFHPLRTVNEARIFYCEMVAPFLLFAAATAQHPPKVHTFLTEGDYPEEAIQRSEEGTAFLLLLVDPVGQVDTCTIIESTGFSDLDRHTCRIIQARAKYVPAKDDTGRPVFGLFRVPVTWALGRSPVVTVNPDFDITINHGPPGVRLPLKIEISYFVTPTGAITKCHQSDTDGPPELVDVACKVASATPYGIVRDHNGAPVTAMEDITVRFSAKR
jgi:TonB family protein